MNDKVHKATIEYKDRRITFEGPRDFVEEQVTRFSELSSKQQVQSTSTDAGTLNTDKIGTERDLIAAKNPKGHLEIVAVLAFYLTESGIKEFSEEDIRRAYIRAGVRPPKVVAQALRDAKNNADLIELGSRRGRYRLSAHGDRTVRFDLPRKQ